MQHLLARIKDEIVLAGSYGVVNRQVRRPEKTKNVDSTWFEQQITEIESAMTFLDRD